LINEKIQEYTLDFYQEQAFRTAFDTSISLIQGPPGTGKTYIGEKIAKLMLEMLKIKKKEDGLETGPILLTCYTNHALD
jgi:superfamily II DNA or RNA helicase